MASRGVNKVVIIGNLGQDPEIKYLLSGDAVANISVATSETWKDKQSGAQQERTEWHRISAFGKLAEIMRDWLHKGSKIYIEGSLRTRKWQAQDGQDRYTTEIIASELQMLDSKPEGHQQPNKYQQEHLDQSRPQSAPSTQQARPDPQAPQQRQPAPGGYDDFEDDIPFAQYMRGTVC